MSEGFREREQKDTLVAPGHHHLPVELQAGNDDYGSAQRLLMLLLLLLLLLLFLLPLWLRLK